MATSVHTNSNTLNPFHTYKPHIHHRYFIIEPPRQPERWNGPTGCKNLPPSGFNQLMRDMQMPSLWDYALSNSSPPHSDTGLINTGVSKLVIKGWLI